MVKGSLTDRGLPHSVFSWGPEVKSSPLFCKWRKLRTKKGEGTRQRHHYKRHYPGFKQNPPLSVLVTNTLLYFSSLLLSHLVDRSHVLHWGVSLRTQCSSLDFHWWIGFYWMSDHPSSSFQHLIGLSIWESLVDVSLPHYCCYGTVDCSTSWFTMYWPTLQTW